MKKFTYVIFTFAMIVLLGIAVGGYIFLKNFRLEETAKDRVRMLSWYIAPRIDSENHFPLELKDNDIILNRQGVSLKIKDLLIDPSTRKKFIYKTVIASGEKISHTLQNADRFILWSPESSYQGKRLILMNDLSQYFVDDKNLDFVNQKVLR
jgi:hypothetical protein